jgi:hypothetical protein
MPKRIKPRLPYWAKDPVGGQFYLRMVPYTHKELSGIYGMKEKAMTSLIRPIADLIGPRSGIYYNVRQLEKILEFLGPPSYAQPI